MNEELLEQKPPVDSSCDGTTYCMDASNSPQIDYFYPRHLVAGCPTAIIVNLVDFPVVKSAKQVKAFFGSTEATVLLRGSSPGVANLTLAAPASLEVEAEHLTVLVSIGSSSATFKLSVSAPADTSSASVIRASPLVGSLVGGAEVFIEANGFPVGTAASDLRVSFGGEFVEPLTFSTSGSSVLVTALSPASEVVQNVTLSVQVSSRDCQDREEVHHLPVPVVTYSLLSDIHVDCVGL